MEKRICLINLDPKQLLELQKVKRVPTLAQKGPGGSLGLALVTGQNTQEVPLSQAWVGP